MSATRCAQSHRRRQVSEHCPLRALAEHGVQQPKIATHKTTDEDAQGADLGRGHMRGRPTVVSELHSCIRDRSPANTTRHLKEHRVKPILLSSPCRVRHTYGSGCISNECGDLRESIVLTAKSPAFENLIRILVSRFLQLHYSGKLSLHLLSIPRHDLLALHNNSQVTSPS